MKWVIIFNEMFKAIKREMVKNGELSYIPRQLRGKVKWGIDKQGNICIKKLN
jgi:hypothetical protein